MSMQPVAPNTANLSSYVSGSAINAGRADIGATLPAGNNRPVAAPSTMPDPAEIRAALEDVRNAIQPVASELSFSLDEDSGRVLLRVIDRNTDEVIRQIPSEELLRISKALDRFQGLFLNKEA